MIAFNHPELEKEFEQYPAELRAVAYELAAWSAIRGIKDPVIVCLGRSAEQNKSVGGVANSLHLDSRAIDFRNKHYTQQERDLVRNWLIIRCPLDVYELVLYTHGTGPHFHCGLRRQPHNPKEVA